MDDMQRKREQLQYRRRIAIVTADLHKAQKEEQSLAMEMRRLVRKRTQINAQIDEMERRAKRVENDVRMLANELKTQQKRLNRIS